MDIRAVYIWVSVVGGASVQRRDAEKPPCFVNDSARPVDNTVDCEHLIGYVNKIKSAISAMKYQSESLLRTMAVNYCIEDEDASFMSLSETGTLEETDVFQQNICNNIDSFLEAVREHYDMLNELANYFQYLRKAAQHNSSLERMTSFQVYIYDCLCTMKKTLRAKQQDIVSTVPSGILSELFVKNHNDSRCKSQKTQYISVLDGNRIAIFLETMYKRVKKKMTVH